MREAGGQTKRSSGVIPNPPAPASPARRAGMPSGAPSWTGARRSARTISPGFRSNESHSPGWRRSGRQWRNSRHAPPPCAALCCEKAKAAHSLFAKCKQASEQAGRERRRSFKRGGSSSSLQFWGGASSAYCRTRTRSSPPLTISSISPPPVTVPRGCGCACADAACRRIRPRSGRRSSVVMSPWLARSGATAANLSPVNVHASNANGSRQLVVPSAAVTRWHLSAGSVPRRAKPSLQVHLPRCGCVGLGVKAQHQLPVRASPGAKVDLHHASQASIVAPSLRSGISNSFAEPTHCQPPSPASRTPTASRCALTESLEVGQVPHPALSGGCAQLKLPNRVEARSGL
mmetsp:Transcript_12234/g.30812  ORF Transcript_12234/g.30812 Transcript_12234/m.30812 type:complete len:346 (-) Transcript_12234:167-1204(-)